MSVDTGQIKMGFFVGLGVVAAFALMGAAQMLLARGVGHHGS